MCFPENPKKVNEDLWARERRVPFLSRILGKAEGDGIKASL